MTVGVGVGRLLTRCSAGSTNIKEISSRGNVHLMKENSCFLVFYGEEKEGK